METGSTVATYFTKALNLCYMDQYATQERGPAIHSFSLDAI